MPRDQLASQATGLWRSVGPSHNVFVTESFIDEIADATPYCLIEVEVSVGV